MLSVMSVSGRACRGRPMMKCPGVSISIPSSEWLVIGRRGLLFMQLSIWHNTVLIPHSLVLQAYHTLVYGGLNCGFPKSAKVRCPLRAECPIDSLGKEVDVHLALGRVCLEKLVNFRQIIAGSLDPLSE